jgi:nucleotide-binding universal stress UspA family protein
MLHRVSQRTERLVEAARTGPHDPEVLVSFGDLAEQICAAAERHDDDVIVVRSHHKGLLRRLIDPSVADQVLRGTSRPVLVVSGDSPGTRGKTREP